MMRRTALLFAAVVCCALAASAVWADVKLPEPRKADGEGIFSLLERRASGTRGDFPKGGVSLEELSTILWAGTGRNRDGKGWTVPLAGGRPPYVKIYAVRRDGVFLYDWSAHSLKEISDRNAMSDITGDSFARESACVLVLVSDTGDMGSMASLNGGNSLAYTAAGAMSQNIYLAADALGISVRYMVSMKADAVRRELRLDAADTPICIIPIAKR